MKTNSCKKHAKQNKLSLHEKEIKDNMDCTCAAFAKVLKERFGLSKDEILETLEKVNNLLDTINKCDEYPNPGEFKVKCSLEVGINIGLNKEQKRKVEEIYSEAYN